jgi:hypothetical protein
MWELPAVGAVTAPTAVLIPPDGNAARAADCRLQGLPDALTPGSDAWVARVNLILQLKSR